MNSNMARGTVFLGEQRLADLKRLAAERGITFHAIVDEFLRQGIERSRSGKKQKLPLLPPGMNMGRELVDISDRNRLYDIFDSL